MGEIKKTSAEFNISIIGTIILVVGILASIITFISNCYVKPDPDSEPVFVLQSVPTAINVLLETLLAWAVCYILCEISLNTRIKEYGFSKWEKDFALEVALNNKEKAKSILYAQILDSVEFSRYVSSSKEESKLRIIESINKKFRIYLDELGIESFKLDTTSPIWNEFKANAFQS